MQYPEPCSKILFYIYNSKIDTSFFILNNEMKHSSLFKISVFTPTNTIIMEDREPSTYIDYANRLFKSCDFSDRNLELENTKWECAYAACGSELWKEYSDYTETEGQWWQVYHKLFDLRPLDILEPKTMTQQDLFKYMSIFHKIFTLIRQMSQIERRMVSDLILENIEVMDN